MKVYISPSMQEFITPAANEEALDQPLYHVQSYGTAGALAFTFFNVASGSATNGLSDTNMDASQTLSAGKRFAIFGISVAFIPGSLPVQSDAASFASALNDAKKVLEGTGYLKLRILDKDYLFEAPLLRCPAGMGLAVGAGGIQRTQAAAANGYNNIDYGTNGVPMLSNRRVLRVPLPIPPQVKFDVSINFPALVTVTTAARLGVWLDGMLIRAKQ